MAKRISDYEIIDHGARHSQYFSGCGVKFTRFAHVVTGIGENPFAAACDAIEQIHMMGDYDTDGIELAELVMLPSDIPAIEPGDEGSEDEPGAPHPDFHHYVSIRWND